MIPVSLLLTHFIGDFLLQNDWMALNKSKSWFALTIHCWLYSFVFLWIQTPWWFSVCFCTHFCTDAITSRWTSKLYQAGHRHWFFVVIGLDQLIHYFTLALMWRWLVV